MADMERMQADVVVVGSGPGGATVARDLTLAGRDVLLLERGGDNPPGGNVISALKYVGGPACLGKGVFITREGYQMVRCLTTGGTSMMYLGCAWDPPDDVMSRHGIDISAEAGEIRDELGVQPVPDHLLGPRAKRIMEAGLDLGHDWRKIPKFLNPDNCRADCNRCFYGCPHNAKWHARDWVVDAMGKGLRLRNNMKVDGVLTDNGRAVGVRATGPWGREVEVRAKAVVVSAGGVGSPVILKKSGIDEAGDSFFFDPFIVVYGDVPQGFTPNREFPMAAGMHLPDEGIMVTDMPVTWSILANNAVFSWKPQKSLQSNTQAGLLVKVRDSMEGAISADEKIASKPLTAADREKLRQGYDIAEKVLKKMGARGIWASRESAAHPGGTCRIGHVVDSDLQTRKYENLFVADASVIPEPWGLPPTLTVASLARRLSRRLAGLL
ncbi:MAG: GMC family oxidoreductase N-terminal domain-containing protein [Desulfatibacillaceae bacterium]